MSELDTLDVYSQAYLELLYLDTIDESQPRSFEGDEERRAKLIKQLVDTFWSISSPNTDRSNFFTFVQEGEGPPAKMTRLYLVAIHLLLDNSVTEESRIVCLTKIQDILEQKMVLDPIELDTVIGILRDLRCLVDSID